VNHKSEIEAWRIAWHVPTPAPTPAFEFRAEHRRQQRWLRVRYVAGLLFALLLIVYAASVLRSDFRGEVLAWAVVVWVTTLGVTAFSVWNWRGLLNANGHSVQEYANSYEKRSLATLRAMRFGYWFLGLQLSITVPWLTWDFARHQLSELRYAGSMVFLALFTAVFLTLFKLSRRRALLELERVEEFRRSFGEQNGDSGN
jgi:hypothetical protein